MGRSRLSWARGSKLPKPDDNFRYSKSRLSWARGSKHLKGSTAFKVYKVAPFMGAWIETMVCRKMCSGRMVAPFMGAWIETFWPKRNSG